MERKSEHVEGVSTVQTERGRGGGREGPRPAGTPRSTGTPTPPDSRPDDEGEMRAGSEWNGRMRPGQTRVCAARRWDFFRVCQTREEVRAAKGPHRTAPTRRARGQSSSLKLRKKLVQVQLAQGTQVTHVSFCVNVVLMSSSDGNA